MKFFSISFLAISLLLITSCESDDEGYISLSDELTIKAAKKGESVELTWTLTDLPRFLSYTLYHSTNKNAYRGGGYSSETNVIFSTDDYYKHSYTHKNPNVLGQNYYWVSANIEGYDQYGYGSYILSNLDSVNISGYPAFNSFPKGIEFYATDDLLCFVDGTNTCKVYNYTQNEVLSEIPVGYNFTYPCFAKYNGVTELYVSDQSNSIKIYDTKDYSVIQTINLNSSGSVYSIASNGSGILYVSTTYGRLYVVDRVTNNIMQEFYVSDDCYLKYDDQQKILIANENDSYGSIYRFTINAQGLISNSRSIYARGYHYPAVKLNSNGVVYTLPTVKYVDNQFNSLYETSYHQLQDVEFDGSYFYCAPVNVMSVIKYNNTVQQSIIDMPGYPVYLFKDGNKLITLFVEGTVDPNNLNYNRSTKGYSYNTPFGIKIVDL